MRRILAAAALVSGFVPAAALAKDTRFWNLTADTITSLQLAPAGSAAFGKNQCENDKDGSVDHDERLKVTDVKSGFYDAKLSDSAGRECTVKSISITEGAIFSIGEKDLIGCRHKAD